MLKRLMAFLLIFACLLPCARAEDEILLPGSLVSVQEQAFENAGSIRRVVVPEGAQSIASRAFAGSSLQEIVLPESVSFIAEDAFDGCGDLTLFVPRNSYAHLWCTGHDFAYEIIDDGQQATSLYGVHALQWVDGAIRAVVSTENACILITEILSEGGAALWSRQTPVEAGLNNAAVDVQIEMDMPAGFILRAVLVDANAQPLCDARTNSRHTAAHKEFENRTSADYDAARVMDFGESGFAVLNENVKRLDVNAAASGEIYTFPDDGFALQNGDVVRLRVNGEERLIKLAAAGLSGGVWQVQADSNLCLAECYDVLKIDAHLTGQSKAGGVDESVTVFDVTPSVDFGAGEAGVHAWADVHLKADYDVNLLGKDYFNAEITVEINGDISVSLHREIDTFKNDNAPAIQLYNSVVLIPHVPAPAFLNVSLPLNIYAKGGGVITAGFSSTYGFNFNTIDGFSAIEESDSHAEARVLGEFAAEFGPEMSLTVGLWEFFNARLGGGFGLGTEGELQMPSYGGSSEVQDSRHACLACVDMNTYGYAKVRGTVVYKISKQLSGSLLDWPIADEKWPLSPAYYSFENEENSIFSGAATFGWGDCPNHKYRVETYTRNLSGAEVSGIPLIISGARTETLTASSPAAAYLYDGNYTAAANFQSGQVLKNFSIQGAKQSVTLQEEPAAVCGVVRDKATGKGISGAAVTLTLPDGSMRTASTDSSGAYRFDDVPGGKCSLRFAKKDYKDEQITGITCPAGEETIVNASLVSSLMPDEAVMRHLMDFFGEDLIQQMKDAQITLSGGFDYYVPAGMPAETTDGAFLMMELRLTTPLNFTYPVDQVDYDVMRDAQCALLDANVFGMTAEEIEACKELVFNPYSQGESVFVMDETVEHYMVESPNYQGVVLLRHNYSTWDEANVLNQLLKDKEAAWSSYIVWDELRYRDYE